MLYLDMIADVKKINIVTIGGGKGQATILSGLKKYLMRINISAIVSMTDNGGSTGRLRNELGIPSFGGDFRDVLTALSENKTMIDLFHHRYDQGEGIKGHSVGNLILLGLLEKSNWSILEAISSAKELLNIDSEIFPSTVENIDLIAECSDGKTIRGQNEIDNNLNNKNLSINKIKIEPENAKGYSGAINAILNAELIVLCPGDIYGSLICNLVVPGISDAIGRSNAKLVYITNLMTKSNHTSNWKVSRYIDEVQRYLSKNLDFILINERLSESDISQQYTNENWGIVKSDIDENYYKGANIIKSKLWQEGKEFKRVISDVIPRSFIRHDSEKISKIIMSLFN